MTEGHVCSLVLSLCFSLYAYQHNHLELIKIKNYLTILSQKGGGGEKSKEHLNIYNCIKKNISF